MAKPKPPERPTLLVAALLLHGIKKADLRREAKLGKGTLDRLTSGSETVPRASTLLMLTAALSRLLGRPLTEDQVRTLVSRRVQSPLTMSDEVREVLEGPPPPAPGRRKKS